MLIQTRFLKLDALPARALFVSLWLTSLLLAPRAASAGAVVSLTAQPDRVAPGDTVTLTVNLSSIERLYGIEIHLRFDADRLQLIPAANGKAAAAGELLTHDFVALNAYDNEAGNVDYAAAQMNPRAPVSGSGTLLRLTFKTVADGAAAVNVVSLILSDIDGIPLAATTANTVISVLSPGATPPPATPAPGITALAPPAELATFAPPAATTSPAVTAQNMRLQETAPALRQTETQVAQASVAAIAATAPALAVSATLTPIAARAAQGTATALVAQPDPGAVPTTAQLARNDPAASASEADAQQAIAPALPEAPTRLTGTPTPTLKVTNIALLGGAVTLLAIAATLLLWWRRQARP